MDTAFRDHKFQLSFIQFGLGKLQTELQVEGNASWLFNG